MSTTPANRSSIVSETRSSFSAAVTRSAWRMVAIWAVALGCSQIGGCNTTEGVGKDVKAVGAGVESAAREAKDGSDDSNDASPN